MKVRCLTKGQAVVIMFIPMPQSAVRLCSSISLCTCLSVLRLLTRPFGLDDESGYHPRISVYERCAPLYAKPLVIKSNSVFRVQTVCGPLSYRWDNGLGQEWLLDGTMGLQCLLQVGGCNRYFNGIFSVLSSLMPVSNNLSFNSKYDGY